MAASIDKKKRLIRIKIILGARAQGFLDQDISGSVSEQLWWLLSALTPQMAIDEQNWTTAQNGVWSAFEPLESKFDPEAVGDVSEENLESDLTAITAEVGNL